MFEPDEYIFTKFAYFFKRRKKQRRDAASHAVKLDDLRSRLTIIARALTGEAIELFEAEQEGGFKGGNFFLPERMAVFPEIKDNVGYYLFRTLYMSVQFELGHQWLQNKEVDLENSRKKARQTSEEVLAIMFKRYPVSQSYYYTLSEKFLPLEDHDEDRSHWLYGKWMTAPKSQPKEKKDRELNDDLQKKGDEVDTQIKAKAVEEIISVEIDQKQLEDAVLQHQFEKVETADEFGGNFRDMDGDDELKDHENALEELQMRHTVRVDDPVHSVYQAEFTENTTIAESADAETSLPFLWYDEWDAVRRRYRRDHCKVFLENFKNIDENYYQNTLQDYKTVLNGLRKMLTSVNNRYQLQRRQIEGEAFDLDATTDLLVDVLSNQTPSEKIYLSKRKKEKDLSILLLLDSSMSSDSYAAGNRVIDVEKQVSILFGEILFEFNIDFSIASFHSKTRNQCTYTSLKSFDEPWSTGKLKIGAKQPGGYTRIGAALRHGGHLLSERPTKNKWLLFISDGKPNDYDRYEGQYGIQDVKQALRELNERQIHSYALAIEAQAKYYLPQMFGQNHYQILTTPVALLESLVKLYERIKHQG